jgi:uridine kinase
MYCIGIAGGTGAGKTSLAQALRQAIGEQALVIAHDWYYRDFSHLAISLRARQNFDHPEALETCLLIDQLQQLRKGEAVEAPQYDFVRHLRIPETLHLDPRPIVIVEGVLALSEPDLLAEYNLRVYIEAPPGVRFARRLHRDLEERGRDAEDVLQQWETQVRPMHEAFVEPARSSAELIVSGEGPVDEAVADILARIPPQPL